jgi:hypothetical protein
MNQTDKRNNSQQRAGWSQSSRPTPQKPKSARSLGLKILDAFGLILELVLNSRFALLGLLLCIAGVVILVTNFHRGFSYGIELLALGIASAALGYWFTRGRI